MNRHVCVIWLVCLAVTLSIRAVSGQQPAAEYYDTTKIITLKGSMRLRLVLPPPTPMMITIEVTSANGQKEIWVLTGNPMTALRRDGWQLIGPNAALQGPEEVVITAYLPKDGQKAITALRAFVPTTPAPRGVPDPSGFIAEIETKRARLAYGLEITKADGQKLRFGDAQP